MRLYFFFPLMSAKVSPEVAMDSVWAHPASVLLCVNAYTSYGLQDAFKKGIFCLFCSCPMFVSLPPSPFFNRSLTFTAPHWDPLALIMFLFMYPVTDGSHVIIQWGTVLKYFPPNCPLAWGGRRVLFFSLGLLPNCCDFWKPYFSSSSGLCVD